MKPRKRVREDPDHDPQPDSKHPRLQPATLLPTPSPTASPTQRQLSKGRDPRKQLSRASPQSEPKTRKRTLEDSDLDCAHATKRRRQSASNLSRIPFVRDWLRNLNSGDSIQEKSEDGEIIVTIEQSTSPQVSMAPSQAASDQVSARWKDPRPGSVASAQTERLNTSSPLFRSTLKRNGIFMDITGMKMPREVLEQVNQHIRKERLSPPLGNEEKLRIFQEVEKIWDKAEQMVSDIVKTPLFPLDAPGIAEGRDTLWSTKPLPNNPNSPYALPAPKTDRHYGFPASLSSDWSDEELTVVDHPKARPYTQPTRENLFPSFLVEAKSEVTGGTIYAGEGQAAVSGAHRVSSLLWLLDQVDPSRSPSSADALAFSAVVSQREAVAHVHYYNPEEKRFYMSYIDTFPFLKDYQQCRNHHKNVADWLLNIQQPIVRDLLTRAHPLYKTWKKGRSAGAITDGAESFTSEDGRSSKSQKTVG